MLSLLRCAVLQVTCCMLIPTALCAEKSRTTQAPQIGSWGFDLTGMDRSVNPGDDFYSFANGEWMRRTGVPSDRTVVGSFPDLRFLANLRVRQLLDSSRLAGRSSSTQKAALFYRTFLDENRINKLGRRPLEPQIRRIAAIKTKTELAASMGRSFGGFGSSIFQLDLAYDRRKPKSYAVYLGQGGLGLPDRDYYLEPQFVVTKDAYRTYIARMLRLVDWPQPDQAASQILVFESEIANASWSHADQRDPGTTYNPAASADLERLDPGFSWGTFLRAANLTQVPQIIVTTNTSVHRLAGIFDATPLSTLKAWQAFHTADTAAPYLSGTFVQAHFDFHMHAVAGQVELAPRWVRAVNLVNEAMGSGVGELYASQFLTANTRRQMDEIVRGLRAALKQRLETVPWMSESTRSEALRKLANLKVQIGTPARWIDYSGLHLSDRDLFGNVKREKAFDWNRRVSQLQGPWNECDWRFWPQYPTAYTEDNTLIFTAAMLQPPFFDPVADPAVNYGAVGSVIGHELTHSFDDQGRKEDADSRLRDWWTTGDAAQFQKRADELVVQYSAMEPIPGMHIRGAVTLGENIADLGGVAIAFEAYEQTVSTRPALLLDGFTGEQRFFLGWAQVWREKWKEDALRKLIATDVHSPGTARVNGVMRNLDFWYTSFAVKPQQYLFLAPNLRAAIW
jgi:putative endopeptidase